MFWFHSNVSFIFTQRFCKVNCNCARMCRGACAVVRCSCFETRSRVSDKLPKETNSIDSGAGVCQTNENTRRWSIEANVEDFLKMRFTSGALLATGPHA